MLLLCCRVTGCRRISIARSNGSALTAAHFWQTPGWSAPPKLSKRSCPLHPGLAALDLIRFAHPAGQPSAVTSLRSVSSFHHCFRGPPRRAILGPSRLSARASCVALPPASMQSSRHPCRSTPYTTIPLGLLMGRLSWPEWMGSAGQRVGFCFVGWVEQGDTHAVG